MKFLSVVAVLTLSSLAWAQPDSETIKQTLESQEQCGRFVQYDDKNLYMGFSDGVKIIPLGTDSGKVLGTTQPLAVQSEGDRLFVLTPGAVQEWRFPEAVKVSEVETYALGHAKGNKENAHAWARYQNKMIIAHGRLGVSFYNLEKKRLTNQFRLLQKQAPLESMATGVTVQGRYAYVVMDNFHLVRPPTPPPFRGVVIIDMESEKVIAEVAGLDPGVTMAVSDSNYLIVSYGGSALWKYKIESNGLVGTDPVSLHWRFPWRGRPTGTGSLDQKYLYTCYMKAPENPEDKNDRYRNVPVAIERAVLGGL